MIRHTSSTNVRPCARYELLVALTMNTPMVPFSSAGGLQRPATSPRELAIRAGEGNSHAIGRLLRVVTPNVVGTVRAILGTQHPDLDDAIQLALIGFVQALPAYRGDCEPAGYARVIAARTAIASRKRERQARARRDDDAEPDTLDGARPSPSEATAAGERRELVRDLLADLPEEQAETLLFRVTLGWSLEEIASHTGAPLNTVRSRLRLAKERLRTRIEADPALRDAFDRP